MLYLLIKKKLKSKQILKNLNFCKNIPNFIKLSSVKYRYIKKDTLLRKNIKMKKYSYRKGNNMVEYALTSVLVGVVAGYALFLINPDVFKNAFKSVFINSSSSGSTITIGPVGETDLSGISVTF